MLDVRRSMSDEDRLIKSAQITRNLLEWDVYLNARVMMAYLSMPDEPSCDEIIKQAWADGKQVVIPFLTDVFGVMRPVFLKSFDHLIVGKMGLRALDECIAEKADPAAIDIVLVPGVAFDRSGYRIGMGAGYYDRFLPMLEKAKTVGVTFYTQVLDAVPHEVYDVPVAHLLTESGVLSVEAKCS